MSVDKVTALLNELESMVDRLVVGGAALEIAASCLDANQPGSLNDVFITDSADEQALAIAAAAIIRSFRWGLKFTMEDLANGLVRIVNGEALVRGADSEWVKIDEL